jgi:hypothetical protein
MNPAPLKIGLCETCQNVQVIRTRQGSTFYLCKLWEKDPRFPKYPRLPVLACEGYVQISHRNAAGKTTNVTKK